MTDNDKDMSFEIDDKVLNKLKFKKDWKDISFKQKVIVIIGLVIIFSTMLWMVLNKDKLVTTTEIVTYPDGCNETWINGNINSTNCTYGRAMVKRYEYKVGGEMDTNILINNIK